MTRATPSRTTISRPSTGPSWTEIASTSAQHGPAAVDHDVRPADPRRLVGGQEDRRVDDVLGLADAAEGDAVEDDPLHPLRRVGEHRRRVRGGGHARAD